MKNTMSKIIVRKVWQSNLMQEFELIRRCLDEFRFVALDTEFPGTIYSLNLPKHAYSSLSPPENYSVMKINVNWLKIIQIGLTLSDSLGNLPDFGSGSQYVWEFNFRDFDPNSDFHSPDSIALLRGQGIDFEENKHKGIDSRDFAFYFMNYGLGMGRTWVTFHGLYDFGFLIKILSGRPLPYNLADFMSMMRCYFGMGVYDLKHIAATFGMRGGLEKVVERLGLDRVVGKNHQAGSDSLLIMQAFVRLVSTKSLYCNPCILWRFSYMLNGLTC